MNERNLETDRLSLKVPTMKEQYDLWNILRQESVWQHYMCIPKRFNNDRELFQKVLDDWDKQKRFFQMKIDNLDSDSDKYTWSIYLKDGTVIGQMTVQPNSNYPDNPKIRNVGWYIDPKLQGRGYAYEAASKIIDYMFTKTDVEEIKTEANIINKNSWKLMEKLGFVRIGESLSAHYDKEGNQLSQYNYKFTKEMYLSQKRKRLFDKISTPEDLMTFMDDNIIYGILDNNGDYHNWDLNEVQRICQEEWKFKNGYDVMLSGVGHCWDQTELERYWFDKNEYEYKTLFIFFEHNTKYTYGCHTYLIYKDSEKNKWCWFEHADEKNKGIHIFDTMEEAIDVQMQKHIEYNKNLGYPIDDDIIDLIRVYEFVSPKVGCNNQGYLDNVFSNNSKDLTPIVMRKCDKLRR